MAIGTNLDLELEKIRSSRKRHMKNRECVLIKMKRNLPSLRVTKESILILTL